jgi:hypothetical protein
MGAILDNKTTTPSLSVESLKNNAKKVARTEQTSPFSACFLGRNTWKLIGRGSPKSEYMLLD